MVNDITKQAQHRLAITGMHPSQIAVPAPLNKANDGFKINGRDIKHGISRTSRTTLIEPHSIHPNGIP